jgi:hypothetical protein
MSEYRMISYEEFCAVADELVDALPEKVKEGIAVYAERTADECTAFNNGRCRGRDLIFGYFQQFYGGMRIVLCYWAFVEWARSQGAGYDWRSHLGEVVAHEFQHYLESGLSYQPLAEAEKRKLS